MCLGKDGTNGSLEMPADHRDIPEDKSSHKKLEEESFVKSLKLSCRSNSCNKNHTIFRNRFTCEIVSTSIPLNLANLFVKSGSKDENKKLRKSKRKTLEYLRFLEHQAKPQILLRNL
ncbi:unnamed protein product [Acanthoscelides obtectus]|uniref:Uncharacterized protein n=1 Tax=Acanthoscelides obtectus TaxID=200917 RepID=A0A9P0K0X3_ACAOB|nr:unnamed protein product [Acanthoscelides obtectus]CAK1663984.1 hypothetical protein AOBTE_LOCUS23982 [Acanthoscelides obtectus]